MPTRNSRRIAGARLGRATGSSASTARSGGRRGSSGPSRTATRPSCWCTAEAEVHSGARAGQEEAPGYVESGRDGRTERKVGGLEEDGAEDSKINFNIKTIKWDEDGSEKSTSAEVASILGMILTFIIYMFIIMYGGMVMQGVMEEKTNRIIEVMISSVKPFDLMMGKIIGIGFVGLTQVFLWGILTTVLVSGSLFFFGGNTSPEDMMTAQMTAQGINGCGCPVLPISASRCKKLSIRSTSV